MILFPEFHQRYGPWAIVAGASEGIGQAYAHVLAERGLNLVTLARRIEVLEQDAQLIRRRHRVEVRPVSVDLAAPDLAQQIDAATAGLDIGLGIYNACYSRIADFTDVALDDHQRMLDVNCRGPLILAQRLGPRLVARKRGGLLLMSSMSGFQGSALIATYAATKAFNITLAESLWTELKPHGVDVIACVAGATLTPGFESYTPEAKRGKAFPMRADAVAREGLAALGKGPIHIAGRLNRLVNGVTRFMSHRQRTNFFSNATRSIYGSSES
ncbi:SDR family NAD(P)-dependent oxidoreductase [Oleomonas cavernae]|nr:SDR family NAD(P)-dependent oxidoreductase [Oleomonas cavernae]